MKNIFKFMGIALIATALMVSCSKDKEDNGEGGGSSSAGSFTATMGSQTMNATIFMAIDFTSQGYLTVYGYESNDQNSRFLQGFLESTVVSNATYEATGGDIMNWRDPAYTYFDADGILGDAGKSYWGYYTMTDTFIENVTAIDLNALNMSANWTAKVIRLEDYVATGDMAACEQMDFAGAINNMTWTWTQAN